MNSQLEECENTSQQQICGSAFFFSVTILAFSIHRRTHFVDSKKKKYKTFKYVKEECNYKSYGQ